MIVRIALTQAVALLASLPGAAAGQSKAKLTRTEVVVIADLSNRVDRKLHPMQLQRDTAIVRLITEEFGSIVRRNRYLFSRDRLRMLYLGGENLPSEPRVDVAKMNGDHRVVVRELPQELVRFRQDAAKPYLIPRQEYLGADLWSWFKHSAPRTLQVDDPDRVTQTRIIILTDGYLEFAPSIPREPGTYMQMKKLRGRTDWEKAYDSVKLTVPAYKLPNTRVLILELAPLRPEVNTTEQAIIERYWQDYFRGMGVDAEFLTNSEALPSVQDAIRKFVTH
jgi:hypothetical protein